DEDGGYSPPNVAPEAADDAFATPEDTALEITAAALLDNDSDANGDPLEVLSVTAPAHGTLTGTASGWLYTPAAGYAGPDSFTYTVGDGTATDTATVAVMVGEFGAVSDDFASGELDPAWVFQGIAGSAGLGYLGPDALATITSPEGVKVTAADVLTAPRLTQAVLDLDFQISAGFLSEPSQQFQEHGLLVIEDEANWIRFDLAYTGDRLSLIVGTIENGSTTFPLFQTVPSGTVEEFRVTRVGDAFTFETRGGGSSDWAQVFSLVRAMDVTEVGVFAGSTSYGTDVPGYTALVDYFESAADPIGIEDGSYVPQNHAPVAVDDSFSGSGAIVLSKADLLANDTDADLDDVLSVTLAGPASHGSAIDNGDGTITYTPDRDFEGTDSFSYILSDGTATDEAWVYLDVVPVIEVWYGDVQTFGSPGEGQTWINILGNVSAEVTELSYTLNGGAVRPLSIGPDTRRLQESGDFNVDIAFAELDGSAADDVVTLVATLANGTTVSRDVTVAYEDGEDWPRNYAIDWSEVADLRDVVQVVDGTWAIGPDGVRPVDLGYDRLLVVGDSGWDNYRLETTVTTHDLENVDPLGRDGGAFAIGMLWGGHTDDPIPDLQPKSGWHPGAAFFYTERLEAHSYHDFFEYLGVNNNVSLEEDKTYNIIVEVHQVGIYDRRYAMKIWEEGTPEPTAWSLDRIETFSLDEAPATGGIYLNAHYYDVSFGDLLVSEITGDDIVSGSDEAEVLIAVTASDPTSGLGEIDVFTGGGGSDTFVLGDASRAYYDDGLAATAGMADYAFVWDFDATEDRVQLHGSAADYALTEDPSGLPPGTAIWRLGGAEPELVGHLHESYGLSLTAGMFSFTDDLIA
ncbi:cadherin-like domain-containing protein, partial [Roseivivax sediminis]